MTELFSQSEFEAALPRHNRTGAALYENRGFVGGEFTYFMPVTEYAGIMIRSSVKEDGYSARSGEDSIRLWLVNPKTGDSVGGKLAKYITRTAGWQGRMMEQLRTMYQLAKFVHPCACGGMVHVGKAKNPKNPENKGLLFASCSTKDCKVTRFRWVLLDKK